MTRPRLTTSACYAPSTASSSLKPNALMAARSLRNAWLNTDAAWAGSFVLVGLVTLTS